MHIVAIDKEELNQKEQTQMKFAGLFFGGTLWLFDAFLQVWLHDASFLSQLFTTKAAVAFLIRAGFFGLFIQLYLYLKTRKEQSE
ncbi:hypothetical protein [Streptococcus cuniculi]|uniref:hypothetical protein n=1 Tax=Streptococcus cuniculi TaxID=1432788 RepID=UPI00188482FA|nr:hypothetical protein [Streptococcus cuniculi]